MYKYYYKKNKAFISLKFVSNEPTKLPYLTRMIYYFWQDETSSISDI